MKRSEEELYEPGEMGEIRFPLHRCGRGSKPFCYHVGVGAPPMLVYFSGD